MASVNIVSLYTSVPVRETIDIILELAFKNSSKFHNFKVDQFRDLLNSIMDNVFIFDDKIYHQHEGLPMGGPASPHLRMPFFVIMKLLGYRNALANLGQFCTKGMSMTPFCFLKIIVTLSYFVII